MMPDDRVDDPRDHRAGARSCSRCWSRRSGRGSDRSGSTIRMKKNSVPTSGKYLRQSGPMRSRDRFGEPLDQHLEHVAHVTPSSGTTPPWARRRLRGHDHAGEEQQRPRHERGVDEPRDARPVLDLLEQHPVSSSSTGSRSRASQGFQRSQLGSSAASAGAVGSTAGRAAPGLDHRGRHDQREPDHQPDRMRAERERRADPDREQTETQRQTPPPAAAAAGSRPRTRTAPSGAARGSSRLRASAPKREAQREGRRRDRERGCDARRRRARSSCARSGSMLQACPHRPPGFVSAGGAPAFSRRPNCKRRSTKDANPSAKPRSAARATCRNGRPPSSRSPRDQDREDRFERALIGEACRAFALAPSLGPLAVSVLRSNPTPRPAGSRLAAPATEMTARMLANGPPCASTRSRHAPQRPGRRGERRLDVAAAVGERDEAGLERRWGEVDAARRASRAKKRWKRAASALLRIGEVPDRAGVEEEAEHPADASRGELDAGRLRRPRGAPRPARARGPRASRSCRGARGGAGSRGPPPSRADCPRACPPGRRGPRARCCSISSRAAAVGRGRQAAADHLAEAGEVRASRRSSPCAPPQATRKPVITSSKISSAPWRSQSARRPARKPGSRQHAAHVARDRLDDDARDLAAASSRTRRATAARSLKGDCSGERRERPPARPASPGMPSVATPLPAPTSSASAWPW